MPNIIFIMGGISFVLIRRVSEYVISQFGRFLKKCCREVITVQFIDHMASHRETNHLFIRKS